MAMRVFSICVLGLLFTCACDSRVPMPPHVENKPNEPGLESSRPTSPALPPRFAMLMQNNPDAAVARFVDCLKDLAKSQGWEKQLNDAERQAIHFWEEARAQPLECDGQQYLIAVLMSNDCFIPGQDWHVLFLLDAEGKCLSCLKCGISNRLRMHFGKFHTRVFSRAEADGTQLVIRLDGDSVRGNFAHEVECDDFKASYYWGGDSSDSKEPTEYDEKGLCRAAIRDGKFKILFPTEKHARRTPWGS